MLTRLPPRWRFITKENIRKSSLILANFRDLYAKCLFYWFLNYKHYRCNIPMMLFMHHSEFNIFKMASGMVANMIYKPVGGDPTRWICNRPDALPGRAALYKPAYLNKWTQHACLIELHCTSRHIWEWHRISKHVGCNGTSVRAALDLQPFFFFD